MLDYIIRGGTIVDGTGKPAFRADLGIAQGKISAIENLSHATAAQQLDATGLVVAPGFIDIHSHSDYTLLADPRAHSAVAQGVTTELIGNCGHGCAPIADPESVKGNIFGYIPGVALNWKSVGDYLERLERAQPAVNTVMLVPHGNLRIAVMGLDNRPANLEERRQMTRLLQEGLDQGAIGLSAGLEYPTERASTEEEIIELCRIVAQRDGLYAPHLRNRDVRALESIEEGLRHAGTSGVRIHIPHVVPRLSAGPNSDVRALERIAQAQKDAIDVSIDMLTRTFGLVNLSAALPAWAFEGGKEHMKERLCDPVTRAEIAEHQSIITSFALSGWDHVRLFSSATHPEWAGKNSQALADERKMTPFDAVLDVLADEEDPNSPLCVADLYPESSLVRAWQFPGAMVGGDSTTLCVDGLLAQSVFPGAFTWAAWFFRFVREQNVFTVEEAVSKLTLLPAQRLGLQDRGTLKVGNWADVAVFDSTAFRERETLLEPNQLAQGMRHVLVNGVVEMKDATFTPARGGRVLRR